MLTIYFFLRLSWIIFFIFFLFSFLSLGSSFILPRIFWFRALSILKNSPYLLALSGLVQYHFIIPGNVLKNCNFVSCQESFTASVSSFCAYRKIQSATNRYSIRVETECINEFLLCFIIDDFKCFDEWGFVDMLSKTKWSNRLKRFSRWSSKTIVLGLYFWALLLIFILLFFFALFSILEINSFASAFSRFDQFGFFDRLKLFGHNGIHQSFLC